VLAIETSTPELHEFLMAAAEETLRTDDSIVSLQEDRALLLLLLASPSRAEPVFRRLGDAFERLALPLSELKQSCVSAEEVGEPEDWKVLFQDLHPWPDGHS
jgi:hypothetical protein